MKGRVAWGGVALLAALTATPLRDALEARMSLHMLVQFPLLMLAGALLGRALPRPVATRLAACNAHGLTGLVACSLVLAVLMIPRVLDLALSVPWIEVAKVASLLIVGATLPSSWRDAGLVIQLFFVGNLIPMLVIGGTLYQDAPVRLCNAYGLDDQKRLGDLLVWLAIGLASFAAIHVARPVTRATPSAIAVSAVRRGRG